MLYGARFGEVCTAVLRRLRAFPFWQLKIEGRIFLALTFLTAVGCVIPLVRTTTFSPTDLARAGVLIAISTACGEIGRRSERVHRYLVAGSTGAVVNLLTVWSFAALVTLPLGLAAIFVAVQYLQIWYHGHCDVTSKLFKDLFVGSAAIVAQVSSGALLALCRASATLHSGLELGVSVVLAGAMFVLLDTALVVVGIWLALRPPSIRDVFPQSDAMAFEAMSAILGVGVGAVTVQSPVLAVLMVVPVAYLHRSTMIKSLHQAARVDTKTGLLNSTAWAEHAKAALARCSRAGRRAAVVLIDIDHFKAVNDGRGHLVGDQLLVAMAGCLRRELRNHDEVGRFGGDEFVIVLEEVDAVDVELVANRLQAAVAGIAIDDLEPSVSIGVAHTDTFGHELDTLMRSADTALYAAKEAGRGRVCVAAGTATERRRVTDAIDDLASDQR